MPNYSLNYKPLEKLHHFIEEKINLYDIFIIFKSYCHFVTFTLINIALHLRPTNC